MREIRFQHRVATSSLTLPVAALFAAICWLLPGPTAPLRWMGLGLLALTTYVMVELNNTYALIRIRSRMMGATFLIISGCSAFPASFTEALVPPLCLTTGYYALFSSYQHLRPAHPVFAAFACLGVGSQFFPQLIYFAPIFYVSAFFQLHAFGLRTFAAGLLGLAMPFWVRGGVDYCLGRSNALLPLLDRLKADKLTALPDFWNHYAATSLLDWVLFGLVMGTFVVAAVHFLLTYYEDKIRVRSFYYVLLVQTLFATVLLLLLPAHFDVMFRLLTVSAVPLIAHYLALTGSRASNGLLITLLVLLFCLAIGNMIWKVL